MSGWQPLRQEFPGWQPLGQEDMEEGHESDEEEENKYEQEARTCHSVAFAPQTCAVPP